MRGEYRHDTRTTLDILEEMSKRLPYNTRARRRIRWLDLKPVVRERHAMPSMGCSDARTRERVNG